VDRAIAHFRKFSCNFFPDLGFSFLSLSVFSYPNKISFSAGLGDTSLGVIYSNPKSNIYLVKATLDANALLTLSVYARQTQQSAQSFRPCHSVEFDI
jgi:hypothetical protein